MCCHKSVLSVAAATSVMVSLSRFRVSMRRLSTTSTASASATASTSTNVVSQQQHPSQNLIERIVQHHCVNLPDSYTVKSGDFVTLKPLHVMTHDNTYAVMNKFQSLGRTCITYPEQPIFTLDHNVQDTSKSNVLKYESIAAFAMQHGIDHYPAGRGIGHQVMCEEGYIVPRSMVVASDSHSNMYGGLGCLGTPVVRTDAAALWATGRTWWQVPPVAKVELYGGLQPGVTGKDVIVMLCGHYNNDEVLNHAIEFCGEGVKSLSIDDRLTIANMTTEWGALAGVFPVDFVTEKWIRDRAAKIAPHSEKRAERLLESINDSLLSSDSNAQYSIKISLNLSTVSPHVSGPNCVKTITAVDVMEAHGVAIDKAYLVSCVNSRASDLIVAADYVRGRRVSERVEFYIAAASSEAQRDCEQNGAWATLLEAGAIALPSGCGPCIGLGKGILEDGEVGISATNRNFRGRMGAKSATTYLASPVVVAASAIAGQIVNPFPKTTGYSKLETEVAVTKVKALSMPTPLLLDGFTEMLFGGLLACLSDNVNTDGIYPGKYTYQDNLTSIDQAKVAMENYDTNFTSLVRPGDILVCGSNFGTGSSREQAATCLLHCGVSLLIGASFSETFKRNSINNGLLTIEIPDFVCDLKHALSECKPTLRVTFTKEGSSSPSPVSVHVDFSSSLIHLIGDNIPSTLKPSYSFSPIGTAAQELIVAGGLEAWVMAQH